MAAAKLPAPGTQLGPCTSLCQHRDCDTTRRQATSLCRFCGNPIGYETRFYTDEGDNPDLRGVAKLHYYPHLINTAGKAYVLCHAACLEEALDKIERARKAVSA